MFSFPGVQPYRVQSPGGDLVGRAALPEREQFLMVPDERRVLERRALRETSEERLLRLTFLLEPR